MLSRSNQEITQMSQYTLTFVLTSKWKIRIRISTFIDTNRLFLKYISFNSHLSFCHKTKVMPSTISHTSPVTFRSYVCRYSDTDTIHLQKRQEGVQSKRNDQSTIRNETKYVKIPPEP